MKICFVAHKEQVDKSGIPYVFHPIHLAEQMDDEYSAVVALLHDVVEDSEMTLEELETEFPKEIIDASALMTHDLSVDYFNYIQEINKNKLARKVKLADLKHNSDKSRLDVVTSKDEARYQKYLKAIEILTKEQL